MRARPATQFRLAEWRVPALLIGLSLVPSIAGTARLVELASDGAVTTANARFVEHPLPVILHVIAVIPYCVLGAFQFAPAFRHRRRNWHRQAGKVLVVLGLLAASTGLWMAHFYPWPAGDGLGVYLERLFFGTAMLWSIALGIRAILRREYHEHGAWMMRGYAIGLGAGTQVVTHAPWFLLYGKPDEAARTLLMGLGWVINLAVAEWIIRRQRENRSKISGHSPGAHAAPATSAS